MDVYKKNLHALIKKYPDLENKLSQCVDTNYEIVSTKIEGYFTVKVITNARAAFLHSVYNPMVESQRWVESLQFKPDDILYILGFGCGFHIKELLKRTDGQNRIVVLEPRLDLFKQVLNYIDVSELIDNDNLTFIVEDSPPIFKSKLKAHIPPGKIDEMHVFTFPGYQRLFPDEVNEVSDSFIKLARNMRMTENTILSFSKMWPQNIFRNLTHMVYSTGVSELFEKFANKPAFVISAGPSLSKNCELLKEAKDKAVLICVDTALKALLKRDIKPDLVIALDGSELNYKHFEGVDIDDVPLVFLPVTHYKILENYKSPKIVSAGGNSLIHWVNNYIEYKGAIGYGGSVATAAFDLAVRMGADPIIFVGQDLAYPNNKSHADGTIYETKKVEDDGARNKLFVEDIEGNMVLTDTSLYYYLQWFEDAIRTLESRIVIDATEGGAKIAGTKIMTLREAIDKYCITDINTQRIIGDILSSNQIPDITELKCALKKVIKGLQNLAKSSQQGLKNAKKLGKEFTKGCPEPKQIAKLLKDMDKVDKKIKEEESNNFIQIMMQPILLSVMKGNVSKPKEGESEKEQGLRIADRSALLYQGIESTSREMEELINEALMKLETFSINANN